MPDALPRLNTCSGYFDQRSSSDRSRSSAVRVLAQAVAFGHLTAAQALNKSLSTADRAELRRALGVLS
jgi:hypothetical protein